MTAKTAQKIMPHLWYAKEAEEAAHFYASIFPDSRVDRVTALPVDSPSGPAGSVKVVELTALHGHRRRQLLQLQPLRLPPVEDSVLDVRRQQRQPQQAVDEAAGDTLCFGQFPSRSVPALFQQASSTLEVELAEFRAG